LAERDMRDRAEPQEADWVLFISSAEANTMSASRAYPFGDRYSSNK
jgi:hypothetical protein